MRMPKTSLFHIAKRDALPWYQATLIRGCAILLALVVCALVTMLMTGENPFSIYATIFKGAFGTARKTWVTFQNLAVLLGISLAVTPAFKMRFWNIGAEGQVLIGCLATAACMICLGDKIPNALLILISLLAALVAGGIWGLLPAFFKAKWNTNETLFTLMMNYIATQLSAFFIIVWEVPKGAGKIGIINQNSEAGWLPVIGGQKYLLVILVVAILNFSTGSVWGIPAIVAPILLPLAESIGTNLLLVMGAIVSGATLGSHACFYSDATVLTSSCCKIENMDHALSQIPYALCASGISALGYLVCGALL